MLLLVEAAPAFDWVSVASPVGAPLLFPGISAAASMPQRSTCTTAWPLPSTPTSPLRFDGTWGDSERVHATRLGAVRSPACTLPGRYADVIVHRLLAAAIGISPLPKAYEDKAAMRALCDNMNRRHLMSQLAGRASVALHTGIFFKVVLRCCRCHGAVLFAVDDRGVCMWCRTRLWRSLGW